MYHLTLLSEPFYRRKFIAQYRDRLIEEWSREVKDMGCIDYLENTLTRLLKNKP